MQKGTTVDVQRIAALIIYCAVFVVAQIGSSAVAQQRTDPEATLKQRINASTVAILGGSITSAYLRMADDISRAIGDGDDLRVLPIRGFGGSQNVRDLLYLQGMDIGLVNADALEAIRGNKDYTNIEKRLAYIAKLHNEEFHLISNGKVKSATDLNGKVVAFHDAGSLLSGSLIFKKLKIKPAKSLKMLMFEAAPRIRSGEVDAIICVTGKPFDDVERLLKLNPQLRLKPIEYAEALQQNYLPARVTAEDYPGLVEEGKSIQTIAIGAVLAVYNWPPGSLRYQRLEKFVKAFYSNYQKVLARKGRHPKWSEANLAARLPGWQRFKPAADWLAANRKSTAADGELKASFAKFLREFAAKSNTTKITPARREELFREFIEWQKNGSR